MICRKCLGKNRQGARYCSWCGQGLGDAPGQADTAHNDSGTIAKLQSYLPGDLTGKIAAQGGKLEGEHRQVTVMFCDLKESTRISEKLGEERMYRLLDGLFEMMINCVHEYGGTVNKGLGDGIMALFGAPAAMEDTAQRAIRSALAIQKEMVSFGGELKGEAGLPPLRMGIGIHSGPAVVGALGSESRAEFTAVGDTVNLAFRMEELAGPGQVCVTVDTYKLAGGLFRCEALGEIPVKGREKPVRAYRVIAPSRHRTRFDVRSELGLTPLAGRDQELGTLLNIFERARKGNGQAVTIVGQAGVGKSRLLYEFRKAVTADDVTFLEGRCLSYRQGVAFYPLSDLLRANFDIAEGEAADKTSVKVRRWLERLGIDEASTLPYLLELLGAGDSGIDRRSLSPEGIRHRMIEAVLRISRKGARARPLILAAEDLHWMDRATEGAMKRLLEGIAGASIMLVFTCRPEFTPGWGVHLNHSTMNLRQLSVEESLFMLDHLLGSAKADRGLEKMVLNKTEGIPFFIEELVSSMQGLGLIEMKEGVYSLAAGVNDVAVPSTIQDMIMARVDSLPEPARAVLQVGSAIEREFPLALVSRAAGLTEAELLSQLAVLQEVGLLYARGAHPGATYVFRHALTREVVYDSMLSAKKKKLHLQVARAIEELYRDRLEAHYEALAEHCTLGGEFVKAAEYCRLAAGKSEKAGSFDGAIAYSRRRVECLESLPRTAEVERQVAEARTALGMYYCQKRCFPEAREAVEPLLGAGLTPDAAPQAARINIIVGMYKYYVEEDFAGGIRSLEKGLRLADDACDVVTALMACINLTIALSMQCVFERAVPYFERALATMRSAGSVLGMLTITSSISYYLYCVQGNIDLAYNTSLEGLELAGHTDDIISKSIAFGVHGCNCYWKGFFAESEKYLLQVLDLSQQAGFYIYAYLASGHLGFIYLWQGQYSRSQGCFVSAISLAERLRIGHAFTAPIKLSMALARVMGGETDIDLEALSEEANHNKLRAHSGHAMKLVAQVLMYIDDRHSDEAEACIKRAIREDTRLGTGAHRAVDYLVYGQLLRRRGDFAGAGRKLKKALKEFREHGMEGWWLQTAREELAQCAGPGGRARRGARAAGGRA